MIARIEAYLASATAVLNPRVLYNIVLVIGLCGHPVSAGAANLLGFENTPISVALRAITAGAAMLSIVLSLGVSQPKRTRYYLIAISIFWCLYFLRLIQATFFSDVDLRHGILFYWIWAAFACAVPMFALALRPTRRVDLDAAFPWVFVLFAAAAVLAAFGAPSEDGRLGLTNLNPIPVGQVGVTAMILATWVAIYRRPTSTPQNAAVLMAGIVGYCVMVASGSRGPLLTLACLLVFLVLSSRGRQRLPAALVLVLAVVAFVPVSLLLEHAFGFTAFSRLFATDYVASDFTSGRAVLLGAALEGILAHPFTGFAIELPRYQIYPHNIVLEAFMAVGVIGGGLFVAVVAGLLVRGVTWFKRRPAQGWVVLLFLQALIGAQFYGALFAVNAFWLCAGVLISLRDVGGDGSVPRTDTASGHARPGLNTGA